MNKYQKALNKIVRSSCPNCYDDNGCLNCTIKECCNAPAKYWVDTLQKLIDQQSNPTFEQYIKEWEERGWETIYRENHIIFRHHKTYKVIEIDSINLSYKTDEWYDPERPYADRLNIDEVQYITLDLHNLIHKTLKALEVEE